MSLDGHYLGRLSNYKRRHVDCLTPRTDCVLPASSSVYLSYKDKMRQLSRPKGRGCKDRPTVFHLIGRMAQLMTSSQKRHILAFQVGC